MTRRGRPTVEAVFFVVSVLLLVAGLAAAWAGATAAARATWLVAALLGAVLAAYWTVEGLRRGEPRVDVLALLALAGAIAVGELLAGAVVTWMVATGRLLESRAEARSRRELGLLVARAPRSARRHDPGAADRATVTVVPVEEVRRGDRLTVSTGEVVPVDGRLLAAATLDESALTGEPMPAERLAGEEVFSGVVNAGPPFDLITTSTSAESTYAGIVRLVEQAQASSAPFVRMADRTAFAFVPFTLAVAGLAWMASGDPVRAVAVLVVATPCPLLLAAPVAIMSGLSRAARGGVVIKGGAVLERLAAGRVLLFDKTGTLTHGRPRISDVLMADDPPVDADELLRLAASLDQVSPHVLAGAVVVAARARNLTLSLPTEVVERLGYGIEGRVDGVPVRVGRAAWVVGDPSPAWVRRVRRRASLDGSMTTFVSVDDVPTGAFLFDDPIRPDAPRMLRRLREAGITRAVLVTGDRADVAEAVGRIVGVDAVQAERDPAEKLLVVEAEQAHGSVVMVGDGINDAPALAAADVGVALAAQGTTASSEAADVVLTVDRLDRLGEAMSIARRCRRIARQSVVLGMGLSVLAMVVAAFGHLRPTGGALLQEGIDVLAIGNALRAVLPERRRDTKLPEADAALTQRLHDQHRAVRPVVEQVRAVADVLEDQGSDLAPVQRLLRRLDDELLPHERAEERELYPVVARVLGGYDPVGAMSRSHAEIEHQVERLRRLTVELAGGGLEAEDVVELRRLLYGLYGVLRLHNDQEEEGVFSLLQPQ